ncbi:FAD:protein FMN transferase [Bifidobacterium oedipodis]|nr:FAD:protein FMN transferase [Bifidobacterium sp. DSM 109957]
MTDSAERVPHILPLPHALGTGIIIETGQILSDGNQAAIKQFIDEYESALSRFRDDSLVGRMRTASHGGTFDFPDWAVELFDLYDRLFEATAGAIDPCVGATLIQLGYARSFEQQMLEQQTLERQTFEHRTLDHQAHARNSKSAQSKSPTNPSPTNWDSYRTRITWRDIERHGTTLVTHAPVALDFGAAGKGYAVDLLAEQLQTTAAQSFVIDAGGDMLIHGRQRPITIALENPLDLTQAVGTASITEGALCASAPSRRHWTAHNGQQVHHLINALDGQPVDEVTATWVSVTPQTGRQQPFPTATADGLATALFTTSPARLRAYFDFECALLYADHTAAQSAAFPGAFFTEDR